MENSSKYCLYQVDYLNSDEIGKKNKSRKFLNEAASKIGEALSKLAPYLQNQQIRQITIDCLDQVRFLFKEDDYEHEKEVRVLKFVDKEDVLMAPTTEGYRVPHLYVNMEKQIHFKEVILGPRVEKVSEIAQYLHNGINVSKVSMSNIKYR